MDTFAARLASFDDVLEPTAANAKAIGWPHKRPSPAELAHAGFYYNPYKTNPDNTTCFLCERALDGWEEEDNPITEHLKHSGDCGWAIMMDIQQHSSNPAEIENPTSERIAAARRATFGNSWPYDGRRGWLCQSDKMVEGGWYFCPTEESSDLASCAYCKLSLDGWEPKDDPFDEHYRRSSDCSFFVFADAPKKKNKPGRPKKARASKASSRVSTQSVATTVSDTLATDQDDQDEIVVAAKAKPSKKKLSGARGRSTKARMVDDGGESANRMDVDPEDHVRPEPAYSESANLDQANLETANPDPKPKRTARGKKRPSEDEPDQDGRHKAETDAPPPKKRATKVRSSAAQQTRAENTIVQQETRVPADAAAAEKKTKNPRRVDGKAVSTRDTASDVPAQPAGAASLPQDSALNADADADADEEADYDQPDEADAVSLSDAPRPSTAKTRPAKKPKKGSADRLMPADLPAEPPADQDDEEPEPEPRAVEEGQPKAKSGKGPKRKAPSKKTKKKQDDEMQLSEDPASGHGPPTDSGHRTEEAHSGAAGATGQAAKKKTREPKRAKPASLEDQAAEASRPALASVETDDEQQQQQQQQQRTGQSQARTCQSRHSRAPPKTVDRYSDIPAQYHLAQSVARSRAPEDANEEAASPSASTAQTPSLSSRQSSDAENQPPSLAVAPAAARTPSSRSAAQQPHVQPLLTIKTPTRPGSGNALTSACAWLPVDVNGMFAGDQTSDKENTAWAADELLGGGELTSAEKKMTVEEWIFWNAHKGEERLRRECERLVGQFEKHGGRAMRALEGLDCID